MEASKNILCVKRVWKRIAQFWATLAWTLWSSQRQIPFTSIRAPFPTYLLSASFSRVLDIVCFRKNVVIGLLLIPICKFLVSEKESVFKGRSCNRSCQTDRLWWSNVSQSTVSKADGPLLHIWLRGCKLHVRLHLLRQLDLLTEGAILGEDLYIFSSVQTYGDSLSVLVLNLHWLVDHRRYKFSKFVIILVSVLFLANF